MKYQITYCILHSTNLDSHDTDLGRGIAVYTHNSIGKSVVEVKPTTYFNESCLLQIRLRGGDKLLFGCFYRSPTTSTVSSSNNDSLNKLIHEVSEGMYSHICLLGDFNFRDINWDTWTSNHPEDSKEWKFIITIHSRFLQQHMSHPTRRRGNDDLRY